MLSNPFVRHPRAQLGDQRGRTMIVTGATPGSIGFETARALVGAGADVVVTGRSKVDATVDAIRRSVDAGGGGSVSGHPLDLAETASVDAFCAWFLSGHERLDVLVNNAGIHLDLRSQAREPIRAPDGVEVHLRTNYLGTAQLTLSLLPLLRTTAASKGEARVVNLVSALHRRGRNGAIFGELSPYDSWVAYGTSKLALMHFGVELERRFGREGVHAMSVHPGSVFSNIADRGLAGNPILERIRRRLAPVEALILLSAEDGAQTSLDCATNPAVEGGRYYVRCAPERASAELEVPGESARIWDRTLERLAR